MRVSQVYFKQHLGWHFQKHWRVQGKRKILETGAHKSLKEKGIIIEDANEFLKEKVVHERVKVIGYKDFPQKLNNTHQNWHDRPLLTYKDNNVLLEGLAQAKVLTNTVQIKEGLPDTYALEDLSREFNRRVKKIILGSHIFDAEQKKLPKIKDPERPAFNFPRIYGVTQNRVFKLFISKLLNLIETSIELDVVRKRYCADDLCFSYPFEKDGDLIQFQLKGETVLLSENPLNPITREIVNAVELPNIFPIKQTVTLKKENIYVLENIYPVQKASSKYHPHTIFCNYDIENVKNIFEEAVTEEQIYGRTLLKTFTAAASYAKSQFGANATDLPKPVTLQAIQTDGRQFYFGVLQLNTLDLNSSINRNIWYQSPAMSLFDKCSYEMGRPMLLGYNKEIIKHIISFYNKN